MLYLCGMISDNRLLWCNVLCLVFGVLLVMLCLVVFLVKLVVRCWVICNGVCVLGWVFVFIGGFFLGVWLFKCWCELVVCCW